MTPPPPYFQLGAARLYQPDADLNERHPAGTAEHSAYIKTLVWVCTEFFSYYTQPAPAFGSRGLLVAAGRPQVTAPVAFALEGKLGVGPSIPFPEVPALWQSTAAQSHQALRLPDDLFPHIFPD